MNQIFRHVFASWIRSLGVVLGFAVAFCLGTGNAAAAIGGAQRGGHFVGTSGRTVANVGRGNFNHIQFHGVRFSGSRFNGSRFNGGRFDGGRFDGGRFNGGRFGAGSFDHARFGHGRFDQRRFGGNVPLSLAFFRSPSYGYYGYAPYYDDDYFDYDYTPYYYDDSIYRHGPAYRARVAEGRATESLAADIQTELAKRGYYRGAIDAVIGEGTRRALRNFQSDAGLPVTGRMDRATVGELGLE